MLFYGWTLHIFYLICNFCTKQPSCSPGADGPSIHILGVRPHKMCQMLRIIPKHKCPSNKETDLLFRAYITWRWGTNVFTTFQSRNCKVLHALSKEGGGGWSGGMLAQKSFFHGLYLQSLRINCIAINKDLEKLSGGGDLLLGILGGVCHPVLQTPPYFRPKYVILWGGTYLYGLYKGVPSRPLPGRATRLLLLHVALFLEMNCGILYQEPITYIEYFLLETAAYI